jgi:hypothetical protein
MMSSSDPRVPAPILPHAHQQQAPSSGANNSHSAAGGSGHGGDAGRTGQGGQQAAQKPRAPKAYTEPQMAFLKR